MKRLFAKYLLATAAFMIVFVLLKPAFMLAYGSLFHGVTFAQKMAAVWHGLSMDLSMAAYLAAVPALLLVVAQFAGPSRWLRRLEKVYYVVVAYVLAGIVILDFGLYGYWGFRLDTMPFYYFFSSPALALASVTPLQMLGGVLALAVLGGLFYACFYYVAVRLPYAPARSITLDRWRRAAVALVLAALLFLPMRGGVTVSTMNVSRAYFSDNMRLNHAAVNPAFSLLYSLTQPDRYRTQFRFFDSMRARELAAPFMAGGASTDHTERLLRVERPDIYLVVLESFSAHLMPALGGEAIAMRLDTLAREGVLFDRFYASSFRTDRGLAAIYSGLPGQPTESATKYVGKAEHLPSLARELRGAGYDCRYYFGGDINFTNRLAYLRAQGFDRIVSDKDFPLSKRISKWGVPDGPVFDRCMADARAAEGSNAPRFFVVQTSSSHEPFDVPFDAPRFAEGPVRAFAYADSCLGAFVDSLRALPSWERTLVVAVADHWGCYPAPLDSMRARHHIPLVLAGGALAAPGRRISRMATQPDIAATLLAQLGMSAEAFPFSCNAMDTTRTGFAYASEREAVMLLLPDGEEAVFQVPTEATAGPPQLAEQCKAYLQVLYEYINDL